MPADAPPTANEPPPKLVPALPHKPSIAIRPFANLSGGPEQEDFADGMVEEIITALSRISWLFVRGTPQFKLCLQRPVSRCEAGRSELGARYLLEGSVRRAESGSASQHS